VSNLTEHLNLGRRIAIDFSDECARLEAVIADGGRAWCLCKGLTDGFMIGCDDCEEWFHGTCVGITEEETRAVEVDKKEDGKTSSEAEKEGGGGRRGGGELSQPSDGGPAEFTFKCLKCSEYQGIPYKYASRLSIRTATSFPPEKSNTGVIGSAINAFGLNRSMMAMPGILPSSITGPKIMKPR
jgi:hypothetical protein